MPATKSALNAADSRLRLAIIFSLLLIKYHSENYELRAQRYRSAISQNVDQYITQRTELEGQGNNQPGIPVVI
ncbi:hypothetical protein HX866_08430 [Pseudomonas gingeri]|uniref:hypothetical protein n=1 Tax=Pseudomonas gingeri TaxID=117681 RepID=UPI0015A4DB93|nr:hypothetical protein [Pseudomonas gingeri]NWA24915.1 hypothetical protein [Pseudomonas gingeri]